MICPKCGKSDNIVFFVRHLKESEEDTSTTANCLTVLHASEDCGYNQSMMLNEVTEVVFRDWSELVKIEDKINKVNDSTSNFGSILNGIMNRDVPIEVNGEVVEDNELPPIADGEVFGQCDSCNIIQEKEIINEDDSSKS